MVLVHATTIAMGRDDHPKASNSSSKRRPTRYSTTLCYMLGVASVIVTQWFWNSGSRSPLHVDQDLRLASSTHPLKFIFLSKKRQTIASNMDDIVSVPPQSISSDNANPQSTKARVSTPNSSSPTSQQQHVLSSTSTRSVYDDAAIDETGTNGIFPFNFKRVGWWPNGYKVVDQGECHAGGSGAPVTMLIEDEVPETQSETDTIRRPTERFCLPKENRLVDVQPDSEGCRPVGVWQGPHGTGRIGNQLYALGRALTIALMHDVSVVAYSNNKNIRRMHVPLDGSYMCLKEPSQYGRQISSTIARLRESYPGSGKRNPLSSNCSIRGWGPSDTIHLQYHEKEVQVVRTQETVRQRKLCPGYTCAFPAICGNLLPKGQKDEFSTLRFRAAMLTLALPRLWIHPANDISRRTLVIHLRSGDILSNGAGAKWQQPPLIWYKFIIEKYHNTDPVIICTENHGPADGSGGTPVAHALLAWRPTQISMPESDLDRDASLILGAYNLVLSPSSFGISLATANPNVERLYLSGTSEYHQDAMQSGWPSTQESHNGTTIVWVRTNYKWRFKTEQVKGHKMVNETFEYQLSYDVQPTVEEYLPPLL